MQIISANDCARGYNGWLRDWARTASEQELQLFLADHLHDLHQTLAVEMQGTHIEARAAWLEKQHAEALAEDAELAELVQAEQTEQTAELRHIGALQAAHAEALAEDARRTAAELERMHDRLRHQLRHALAEGAIDRAGGQAVLDRLVGADAEGVRSAVVEVAELRAELAGLVAGEADRQAAELAHLGAVQAAHTEALAEDARLVARRAEIYGQITHEMRAGRAAGWLHQDEVPRLVEQVRSCGYRLDDLGDLRADLGDRRARWDWEQQLNAGLAGLQQPSPDLDDPATLIHHDDDADGWVEHDPDHRPSPGPRMG